MRDIYTLSIRCPITSELIDTGIYSSTREALNSAVYQDGTAYCRHCHSFHPYLADGIVEIRGSCISEGCWRPNP